MDNPGTPPQPPATATSRRPILPWDRPVLRILLANAVVLAAGQVFVYAVEANDLGMYVSGGIVLGAQCALVAVLAVLNALRWVVYRTRWHFRRFLGWALAAVLVPVVGGGVWLALVEAMPAFWRH